MPRAGATGVVLGGLDGFGAALGGFGAGFGAVVRGLGAVVRTFDVVRVADGCGAALRRAEREAGEDEVGEDVVDEVGEDLGEDVGEGVGEEAAAAGSAAAAPGTAADVVPRPSATGCTPAEPLLHAATKVATAPATTATRTTGGTPRRPSV